MKHIDGKKLIQSKAAEKIAIITVSIALIYSLISLYFCNHFFFHTEINGVNVSLKSQDAVDQKIRNFLKSYELQLMEKNCETEKISGQEIDLQYNEKIGISKVYHAQNSLKWINSLFRSQKYYLDNLYIFKEDLLNCEMSQLKCLNKATTEPKNVKFIFKNGSYQAIKETYGNTIDQNKLNKAVRTSIIRGKASLDLEKNHCYKSPKYPLSSKKAYIAKALLDRYVSTNITYQFSNQNEILNANTINKWLDIDDNLNVKINRTDVNEYVNKLGKKYDTVGKPKKFKTSTGKTILIEGGLYGWKINQNAETEALFQNIKLGERIKKEPVYVQKALFRGENEIGNTYLEINITKQHIWLYIKKQLITDGPVVTGNPNRGWSTITGTYQLSYKQKNATLSGPGYKTKVTYWMPFYGNIGIHDAVWRYSFGGQIYKRNGTHGCINAPFYLAEIIFAHMEAGTPIICYEES